MLDELSQERLAEGRRILADLTAEHAALERAVGQEWGYEGPHTRALDEWELADKLAVLSAEQLRCLLFAAAEWDARGGQYFSMAGSCLYKMEERPPDLTVGDVRLLAAVAEPGPESGGCKPFHLVLAMVDKLLADGAPGAAALASDVADQVVAWNAMEYYYIESLSWGREDVAELRDRALELAGRVPAPPRTEGAVSRDDGWGAAAIRWLGPARDWPSGTAELLAHCVTPKAARPGPRWEKVCRQRLDAVADPSGLLRGLLELMLTTEPVTYLTDGGWRTVLVHYNERLVRGLVWAAGVLDPDWLPGVLSAVAIRSLRLCAGHTFRDTPVLGPKIAYACFRSLASSGSDGSLMALARIGRATTNGSVLRQLEKTIEEVSALRGVSAASLLDHLTPDHGLDAGGQLSLTPEWTIRLDDRQGAVLTGPAGQSAPPEANEALADIRATVSMVRARLEGLFACRREFYVDDFLDDYVRHPVGGWLATRLVWAFVPVDGTGEEVRGFPDPDGLTVRTVAGQVAIPAGCVVRLLHPVRAEPGELDRLRALAACLGIVPPVRQLWRETYRPDATERAARLLSGRYAGHVLRFRQCYGLARSRGWTGGFLSGGWDGGDEATARRDFPSAGLRASWPISEVGQAHTGVAVDLCLTGSVSFSPLGDLVPVPVPLAEVPPEVFSEAMRDLDLIVSVTTVANDPLWLEEYRGRPVLDRYWERVAGNGLDQLRTSRREVLASASPGDRFELTAQDLIVRGALATYRIDLATANVRMEPAGKWLSFDSRGGQDYAYRLEVLGLPALDDDEILRRILIRAAILADDHQLASRPLLKQIRG